MGQIHSESVAGQPRPLAGRFVWTADGQTWGCEGSYR
jgi:hypothetical protein